MCGIYSEQSLLVVLSSMKYTFAPRGKATLKADSSPSVLLTYKPDTKEEGQVPGCCKT